MAQTLGAAIFDHNSLRSQMLDLLNQRNGDSPTRCMDPVINIVLEALLALAHEQGRTKIYVGEIAACVNALLKARKESVPIRGSIRWRFVAQSSSFHGRIGICRSRDYAYGCYAPTNSPVGRCSPSSRGSLTCDGERRVDGIIWNLVLHPWFGVADRQPEFLVGLHFDLAVT